MHNTTKSQELFSAAQTLMPGGVSSPVRAFRSVGGQPIVFDRVKGAYAWDVDGNRYIDYIGSWGPAICGHAHPEVVRAVQDAAARGSSYGAPTAGEVDLAEQTNVKAAIDSLVVVPTSTNGDKPEPPNEYQTFTAPTDYLLANAYEVGGDSWLQKSAPFLHLGNVSVTTGGGFPYIHVTGHTPTYAVAVLCPIDKQAQQVPFGDPIPAPTCDKAQQPTTIVIEKDLGSVRFPPFMTMVASAILFALSLLGLHWRERDLQELAAKESEESDDKTPATVDA